MIEKAEFVAGLGTIALHLRQPADGPTLSAFHQALEDETSAQEWAAFCRVAAKRFGWRFLPSVPELLDALREFRGLPALDSEAVLAYERVNASADHSAPQGGAQWSYRGVLAKCGKAAAEAFVAAGGHSAFCTTWNEARTREAFIAAYVQAARECPDLRLLPEGDGPRMLPAPAVSEPTLGEAEGLVREIAERMQMPKITRVPVKIDTSDPDTAARTEALREQGRRIVAETEPVEAKA